MQTDFISGSLGSHDAAAIVKNVIHRIEDSQNELILFTMDTHDEDYLNTPEGKKLPVTHCVESTPGWAMHTEVFDAWHSHPNTILAPELHNNTFKKPVFGSENLVNFLRTKQGEIEQIEILGLCTDICVVSNAVMIKNALPHIPISVNAACCAGVTAQSHQEALNVMKMCQIDII